MVKQITLLLAVCMIALSACKQEPATKPFVVNGEITNLPDGKVFLQQVYFSDRAPEILDSADVKSGKFQLTAKAKEEGFYRLYFDGLNNAYVFVNDQDAIHFRADANDLSLDGPQFNTPVNKELKELIREVDRSRKEYATASRNTDSLRLLKSNDSTIAAATAKMEVAENNFRDYIFKVINTTNSPVIAMVALGYTDNRDTAQLDQAFPALLAKFPNHSELKTLQQRYLRLTKGMAAGSDTKQGPPAIGDLAPDFTLTDSDGEPFALSSLRGKYVLVDFWSSWCGPCRRENPNIVEAYQKFKDKNFTVFGVSLDEDRGAWKAAIKKDNLTWKHVSDLKKWESAVVPLYGIEGIPYNVLLDPTGKIIDTDLRGSGLHRKLEEVLK